MIVTEVMITLHCVAAAKVCNSDTNCCCVWSGGLAPFGTLGSQSIAPAAASTTTSSGVPTSNLFAQHSAATSAPAASAGHFQAFAAPASPGAGLFGQPAATRTPSAPFGGMWLLWMPCRV